MTLKTEAMCSSFDHRKELFESGSCFCQYHSVNKTLVGKHRSWNPCPTLPPKNPTSLPWCCRGILQFSQGSLDRATYDEKSQVSHCSMTSRWGREIPQQESV